MDLRQSDANEHLSANARRGLNPRRGGRARLQMHHGAPERKSEKSRLGFRTDLHSHRRERELASARRYQEKRTCSYETANNVTLDTRDYEAFGVRNESAGSDSLAFGFAGEAFDGLSQLAYHRARWMDPTGGRFLGMDTHEGHRLVPITLQKYLYAGLSPVNRLDPSGLDFDLGSISAGIVGIGILATMATADSPFRAFQRGRVTNINLDFYVDFMLLRVEPENGLEYPIAATSGKGEGMNNSDMEREPNIGPIPRGRYHIDTTQISDPNIFIDIARNMVRGDWGDWRVPIFADSGTNTHGRSGFFLHGGLFLGSAGCIDIGGGLFGDASTARLLRDLQADPDHLVPLSTH